MSPLSLIVALQSFILSICVNIARGSELVEPISKDNSPQCDCYLTSGPDPGYFQHHRFWDFRNIPDDVQRNNDYTVAPARVTDSEDDGDEAITSSYFNTSSFLRDWSIQTGVEEPKAAVRTVNSARNVYISRNSSIAAPSRTYLTLRTSRLRSLMSIVEIDSNQINVLHGSIRVRARVIPNGLSISSAPSAGSATLNDKSTWTNTLHPVDPGAVFGFFTYLNDAQESDIEILTRDPTDQIHYSNQPDYDPKLDADIPGTTNQVTIPDWTEWLDHRIDWFPGMSRWYVNDQLMLNKTKNVPTELSGLNINLWGDGDEWSGNMSVGGQVTVGIEWIQMVFNVSGNLPGQDSNKRDENSTLLERAPENCSVACNVDNVQAVGIPQNASSTPRTSVANSILKTGIGDVILRCGLLLLIEILAFA